MQQLRKLRQSRAVRGDPARLTRKVPSLGVDYFVLAGAYLMAMFRKRLAPHF